MVIISNYQQNIHTTVKSANQVNTLPEWKQKLHLILHDLIDFMPPKQLSRELRSFMLLKLVNLKSIPPGFDEQVLHMIAILELMDDAEDNS